MSFPNPICKFTPSANINPVWGAYNSMALPSTTGLPSNNPIREGQIISVYPEDYTCDVLCDGATLPKVKCISPWFNCTNGRGWNVYPEVGSKVVVARGGSDILDWYILGFVQADENNESDTCKNNKPDLMNGDIHISTDTGNFISISKNENTIKMFETEACYVELLGKPNTINICCQEILFHSRSAVVSTITGPHQNIQNQNNKTESCAADVCTSGFFWMNTGDTDNFVKLDVGKVNLRDKNAGDNVILALNICNKFGISIDTEGNITTYTAGDKSEYIEGSATMVAKKTINIKAIEDILVASDADVNTEAKKNISEKAGKTISNNAEEVTHGRGSASPDVGSTKYPEPREIKPNEVKVRYLNIPSSLVP